MGFSVVRNLIMAGRMRWLWSVLLLAACLVQPGQALGGEPFALPPRDRFEVYEALRGSVNPELNYFFTVSPDEQWIALARDDAKPSSYRLVVLNRRTGRTWEYVLTLHGIDSPEWLPNCFSADSKKIAFGGRVAVLSPTMTSLDFQAPGSSPDVLKFEGTALGYSAPPERRPAATDRSPWMPSDEEKRFDEIARSADGKILYESLVKGQVKSSYLRLTPPGRDARIDYGPLFDVANSETRSIAEKFRTVSKEQRDKLTPDQLQRLQAFKAMFGDLDDSNAQVQLTNLSISPDQRFLAGTAAVEQGFGDVRFGVIVPLDRGGLAAYPFAKNVLGRSFWSADASAIYFYVQPSDGGRGTVHRFAVSNFALPPRIPEKQLSAEKLAAPSDDEIRMANYQKTKEAHYELLKAEFAKPQVLQKFKKHWGYTEAGVQIAIYGTDETRDAALEQFVTANLLHRPLKFRLPDRDEFLKAYIPGARRGVFEESTKFPLPADKPFGDVPVLLYDDEGLVNARFQARDRLQKYK